MSGKIMGSVTHGIIVAEQYAKAILDGRKSWEMRTRRWSHRGPVGVIVAGSGKVFGVAEMVDCVELPDDEAVILAAADRHLVTSPADLRSREGNLRRFAWVLRSPCAFESPTPYSHKRGSQTPVMFTEDEQRRIAQAAAIR